MFHKGTTIKFCISYLKWVFYWSLPAYCVPLWSLFPLFLNFGYYLTHNMLSCAYFKVCMWAVALNIEIHNHPNYDLVISKIIIISQLHNPIHHTFHCLKNIFEINKINLIIFININYCIWLFSSLGPIYVHLGSPEWVIYIYFSHNAAFWLYTPLCESYMQSIFIVFFNSSTSLFDLYQITVFVAYLP